MTRELSPLFHMGDEVIPDLAVAELVRWCASWQGAAKAVVAGESKMVRALRDIYEGRQKRGESSASAS